MNCARQCRSEKRGQHITADCNYADLRVAEEGDFERRELKIACDLYKPELFMDILYSCTAYMSNRRCRFMSSVVPAFICQVIVKL